jgi:hypothetical protein
MKVRILLQELETSLDSIDLASPQTLDCKVNIMPPRAHRLSLWTLRGWAPFASHEALLRLFSLESKDGAV